MSSSAPPIVDANPARIVQDILDVFYTSESKDAAGNKDYLDVIYRIYYLHLNGLAEQQQKDILQELIKYINENKLRMLAGNVFNVPQVVNIRYVDNLLNPPKWIADIKRIGFNDVYELTRNTEQLHKIFIATVKAKNGDLYNKYISQNKEKIDADDKWRNSSFFEKIKLFLRGLLDKIKTMFNPKSPVLVSKSPTERVVTQQKETHKESIPNSESKKSLTSKITRLFRKNPYSSSEDETKNKQPPSSPKHKY